MRTFSTAISVKVSQVADEIVARCHEVETGARNIDLIISNTLVPTIATEVLSHMGTERMPDTLTVDINSSGEFSYAFRHSK